MILGQKEILAATRRALKDRLIVTPLLEEEQVGTSSIDLRLGTEFIVIKRANIPAIAPLLNTEQARIDNLKSQESLLVPRGKDLVLHPGELILGTTLEYIRLPDDIAAYVTSRSSWGRLGLVIATAVAVAPGYRGIITLELTNLGNAPLVLSPGVRIAQIVLHRTEGRQKYQGRYRCPTSPELGKLYLDKDLGFWRQLSS